MFPSSTKLTTFFKCHLNIDNIMEQYGSWSKNLEIINPSLYSLPLPTPKKVISNFLDSDFYFSWRLNQPIVNYHIFISTKAPW